MKATKLKKIQKGKAYSHKSKSIWQNISYESQSI